MVLLWEHLSHSPPKLGLHLRPGSSRPGSRAGREGAFLSQGQQSVLQQGEYRKGFANLQPIVSLVSLPTQDGERLGTWASDTLPEAFLLQ